MTYSQLTQSERIELQIFKAGGGRLIDFAKKIGRHVSSLYRELKRNCLPGDSYKAEAAEGLAEARSHIPRSPTKCTPTNTAWVEHMLADKENGLCSPDVLSGRAKIVDLGNRLGTTVIYKIIEKDRQAGGSIYKLLPRGGKHYRKNRTGPRGGGKLVVRKGQEYEARPPGIAARTEAGHVEIDLMHSGETVWLTCQDRHTKKAWVRALESKESEAVAVEICLIFESENLRSATFDRGLEWAQVNGMLLDNIGANVNNYFCNAYSSWEKGGVENLNRQLRAYFPKRQNIPWDPINRDEALRVQNLMNKTPRRSLGYKTPNEVDLEWSASRRKGAWAVTMAGAPKALAA
jgi:IS30 family transposase